MSALDGFFRNLSDEENSDGVLEESVNICKPEEGWYGQPKYCYEKTVHVVMNQLCQEPIKFDGLLALQ